ncbi:MAG TPA: OB-fold domain-containing protein [Sphingomonas sp.]|nr:OB-fold domain-containing protein [Sphingomonas sp.]
MTTRPIAQGVWTDEQPPRLIGGRDRETGRIVFPMPRGNAGEHYEPIPLSREGRIWSWTVQRFPPKSPPYAGPEPFEPFALAYVELPGEVIVESRLSGFDFDQLECGLPVRLTTIPFTAAPDGATLSTYAFEPLP